MNGSVKFGDIESWGFLFTLPTTMMYEGFNEVANLQIGGAGYILLAIIIASVGYFIIGAIIGWIYGKIKNR